MAPMAATRANAKTSPFFTLPSTMAAKVAGAM